MTKKLISQDAIPLGWHLEIKKFLKNFENNYLQEIENMIYLN